MGWLVSYTIASIVGALFIMRLFDYVFAGVVGGVAHIARLGLFVGMWTTITAKSGMRDFTNKVKRLRKSNRAVGNLIGATPPDKKR